MDAGLCSLSCFIVTTVFWPQTTVQHGLVFDGPLLSITLQKIHGQRLQRGGLSLEYLKRRERAAGELPGNFPRLFQADNGRISRLLCPRVFAGGLPQLLGRLREVEDVVDNLEREAHVVSEAGQSLELRRSAVGAHTSQPRRTAEQRRGLALVDVFQFVAGYFFPFAFEVGDLARDELQ